MIEKNVTAKQSQQYFSPTLQENDADTVMVTPILIDCLHRSIVWLSLFIGIFQRAKIYFSKVYLLSIFLFKPAKCATVADRVMIIVAVIYVYNIEGDLSYRARNKPLPSGFKADSCFLTQ